MGGSKSVSLLTGVPPAGLVAASILFLLPPLFVALVGWPSSASPPGMTIVGPAAIEPIAGPAPATGLPQDLIIWTIVAAAVSLGFALGAWLLALLFRRSIGSGSDPSRPRALLLLSLGLVSLSTYGLNFLLPFPLLRYFNLKQISMGMIAERDRGVALATALATVALFLLFGLAFLLCRGQTRRQVWAIVLGGALLLALANVFVSTITTLDPYDYIARGRITGLHGGNPYVLAPKDYPADPFMEYVSWREATSAYGPLWEMLSALITRLAGGKLLSNVLAYKGLALLCYLLSTFLIASILRRIAPRRALEGTLLFAWNPLILMEGVGNGHNDLLMVALLLGAFWAISRGHLPSAGRPASGVEPWSLTRGWTAMVLLAASALVKFLPVLIVPLFLLYLLRGERDWKRWLGRGSLLLAPTALLVVEHYFVFWKWPEIASTVSRRADMFRMSIASVAKEALQKLVDVQVALNVVTWPFLLLAIVGYVIVLGRALWTFGRPNSRLVRLLGILIGTLVGGGAGAWLCLRGGWIWAQFLAATWVQALSQPLRTILGTWLGALLGAGLGTLVVFCSEPRKERVDPPCTALLRLCLATFLLYLLLANFWFWPWYLILPIALLTLSAEKCLVLPLALASCAGELSHLGWNFLWFWWGITWDTTFEMDALVVFWMVVPALVSYAILCLAERLRRSKRPSPQPCADTSER